MKVIAPFSKATLMEAQPGDLVRLSLPRGPASAIVLRVGEEKALVGVLTPDAGGATVPYHAAISRDTRCIRFADWVLEPVVEPGTIAGGRSYVVAPGALHMTSAGLVMNFNQHPNDHDHSEITVDLTTWTWLDSIEQGAIPLPSWRAWFSSERREERPDAPDLRFTAEAH